MTTPPSQLADALQQLLDMLADQIAARLTNRQPPRDEEEGATPWMNADTAAGYLDWPKQRLYKLTAQGSIPHYKHDGRLLFHRQELDQWLTGHRQGARDWMNGENRAISP